VGKAQSIAPLLDRQVELENALTQVHSYTYDAMDNLLTVLDPESQLITNTYDDLSRLTQVSTADNTITYSYDDAGNLLSAVDNDSSLLFTWDALNRLETAETVDVGVQPNIVVTNTWDPVGNRSDLSDSAGGAYGYSYDGAGRLIEATSTLAGATMLGYDPASLASIEHKETLGPIIELFDYMQNAIGNITEIDDQSQVTTVAYDDLEQVTGAGTAGFPETYSYDSLGNRITSHLSAIHVHNAANQLLEDDEFTYTYDDNGNLATRTRKSDMEVATFTWNAQDHLTGFDFPAEGPAVAYRYDALGRRIEKDVGGTVTRYVYDSLDILLEYNGSNVLQARYGHGELSDQPLFMERAGQAYYYLSDHLGSVIALTDSLGASVNQYSYDAYGRRLAGTMESVFSPFSFTGREFDAESGHYFYRARYYDPQAGRFLSPDPLGFAAQDGNLYRYVHSNPVNRLDPLGLLEETTLRIKDTKTASALDILGEVGKTILQSVVPKSKGPLAFGELGGRIGIAIYDAFTDSEKLSGELDVKDFHNSRNLRIRVAVRDILRGKNINCLDTLKPPVRKALRDAAKDRLADVLDELGKSRKALRESFNRGGDRGLRDGLRDQIKNLQQESDFLNEAAYGKPALGE
jgi:RHS repeat-associated protein